MLDYTGPNAVPLLQAIEQQGLIDSVVWASSTPPNDPSVAEALGPAWNDKFLINAEFNVLDSGMPDQNHMNEVREQYAPDVNSSSFAQMGYLAGRIATDALLGIEGEITKESVNEAFRSVTNFTSDIFCKPWYFDSGTGSNVSNNVDITVAPSGRGDGAGRGLLRDRRVAGQPAGGNPRCRGGARPERRMSAPSRCRASMSSSRSIVLGLALGGVFAMSGVGLVVLYRATGVLNLAYGAIGATGALISWSLLGGVNRWIAYSACIAFGGLVTLLYGVVFGPPFAARDPLVKATATIGLLLILLGVMQWVWPPSTTRTYILPTRLWDYDVADVRVNWTQILGIAFPIVVTAGTAVYLRVTKVGTAMRALANDREATAMLGVPVRRVEAAAWLGSGIVCGISGILLGDLVGLDPVGVTFLVIPALAAALIGQLNSLWITLAAGFVIGIVQSCLTAFYDVRIGGRAIAEFRTITPFVLAILALLWFARKRPLVRV